MAHWFETHVSHAVCVSPSNPPRKTTMSKYPFSRMRVGEVVTIPAESGKGPLHVAISKLRDAVRREFGLSRDELPVFSIDEDEKAGTFIIERLPDGTVQPRGPKPRKLTPAEEAKAQAYNTFWSNESDHAVAGEQAAQGKRPWPERPPQVIDFEKLLQAEMAAEPDEKFQAGPFAAVLAQSLK